MKRSFVSIGTAIIATMLLAPAIPSSASSISQTKLTSELLSSSQVPAGWTLSNAGASDGVGCLHGLLEPSGVTQTRSAQAYFLGAVDDLPRFDEKIATYANAKTAYKKIIARISACHTLTGQFNGLAITGVVGPMSLAHVGSASAAYAMTISDARGTLHYDYLIVRKRTVIAAFLEGSNPEVSQTEFEGLVNAGVKKLT